ncbi:hypothetical protein CPSG_01283 [Coccidioides posadasii str. Silveira]|uniref:Uncharacterized protein n=1 Tax=Coccidioides posadasii (strain RMSCC 757 / Silveira) TaxID=443226 RepID=E9CS63_COCPS|nr:hypothetical protein CPSG_01283 [Coccidioides posadasii str. Silveira]
MVRAEQVTQAPPFSPVVIGATADTHPPAGYLDFCSRTLAILMTWNLAPKANGRTMFVYHKCTYVCLYACPVHTYILIGQCIHCSRFS